jgi:hypothetical protein
LARAPSAKVENWLFCGQKKLANASSAAQTILKAHAKHLFPFLKEAW